MFSLQKLFYLIEKIARLWLFKRKGDEKEKNLPGDKNLSFSQSGKIKNLF